MVMNYKMSRTVKVNGGSFGYENQACSSGMLLMVITGVRDDCDDEYDRDRL